MVTQAARYRVSRCKGVQVGEPRLGAWAGGVVWLVNERIDVEVQNSAGKVSSSSSGLL